MELAIARYEYLNKWDCMTFAPLAEYGYNLTAVGASTNVYKDLSPIGSPFKTVRYSKYTDLDWTKYDIIDAPEFHLAETAWLCENHPNVYITVWDLGTTGTKYLASLKKARMFIARSPIAAQGIIKRGIPENQVRVVPASVNMRDFPFREDPPGNLTTFLFVGRINGQKGVPQLISAFARLNRENPRTCLKVVGRGDTGLLKPGGKGVQYLGYLDRAQLAREYSKANVFVGPSMYEEQFGVVFIEAMATGLPIISTDSGAIPWIIQGQSIVPRTNIQQGLYEEMKRLTNPELRKIRGRSAHANALSRFDARQVARQLSEIYK